MVPGMGEPIDPAASDEDVPSAAAGGGRTESLSNPSSAETGNPDADTLKNIPWPRLARVDDLPQPVFSTTVRQPQGNLYQTLMWVLAQVCGFGLLLGGYFLGQAWAPGPRLGDVTARPPRAGSERALEEVNRALEAERAHDFKGARAIYEEMVTRQMPLPGVEYRLALLSLHEGDLLQTEAHLDRSLRLEEATADCYLLRASLAGMRSDYTEAATQLAAAVRSQPFSARFLFCQGEALRRDGRLPQAVQCLTRTLDRPDSPAARALYFFKLRLAKVEAGSDETFDAEMKAQLTGPSPGGDWLLLAAAREIGRKNYSVAAEQLEEAEKVLPREIFSNYMQDYLFQSQRTRPELAARVNTPPPAINAPGNAPIEDPAAWTAAEADPAGWPPFPTAK